MLKYGIINGQLASLLARFRHTNSIAIVDGPFPSYPGVETIDLSVRMGFPAVPHILDQILPLLDVSGIYLAQEFREKTDPKEVEKYELRFRDIPPTLIPHEEFKIRVGQSLGIIHTGDALPYSSVILTSG